MKTATIISLISFYSFTQLLSSCQLKQNNETAISVDSLQTTSTTITAHPPQLDLDLNLYTVLNEVDSGIALPETDFIGTPKDRENNHIANANGVQRADDQLVFTLHNGSKKVLTTNTQDEENSADYIFMRDIHTIGYWEVLAFYYESFDYILINQQNGNEFHLWNKPVVSPDNQHLLCSSVDIEAGFVPNGFQMWAIEKDSLKLQWQKEIENWGADRLMWTQHDCVYAEQTYRDEVNGELKSRMIKLKVLQK